MNADQRIRLCIGDLVVELQIALAKIEELQAQLAKQQAKQDGA